MATTMNTKRITMMTDRNSGKGRRILLVEPVSRDAQRKNDRRLARLLIVSALAGFTGFFGLTVAATPPDSTAVTVGLSAITRSAPTTFRRTDDDDGGRTSGSSEVRTKTS